MAVSTDNAYSGPYAGNGVTTVFPFTFTAPSAAEVGVVARDASSVDVAPVPYTVTINAGAGGSVTFSSPPAAGHTILILLDPSFTQDLQFENGSAWLAEPVNEGYDRAALRDQALKRDVDRALKADVGQAGLAVGEIAPGEVLMRIGDQLVGVANDPGSAAESAERAEDALAGAILAEGGAQSAAAASAGSASAASNSAAAASASAGAAASSALAAGGSASAAQGHAAAAALAAASAPSIYPNVAAGLAVVADGATFWVSSVLPDSLTLYRRNGSVADQVLVFHSAGARIPLLLATYGDRASIPVGLRYDGMQVYVLEGDLWSQWSAAENDWITPSWATNNTVWASANHILDGSTLYYSAFFFLGYKYNGVSPYYEPPVGAAFALPISTGNSIRRHIFDLTIYNSTYDDEISGGASADDARKAASLAAMIYVEGSNTSLVDSPTQIVLAVSWRGRIIQIKGPLAGDVPGGSVPNMFRYGREVGWAPFLYPGPLFADDDVSRVEVVDIDDADLVAEGFTQGIRNKPGFPAMMGDYLEAPIAAGDYIVARWSAEAETPGEFGFPLVWTYAAENTLNTPQLGGVLLREKSSTVREYYYAGRATQAGIAKIAFGMGSITAPHRVKVTKAQYYVGSTPGFWISGADFPAPVDAAPLMGDEIFLTSDRALPFIASNGLVERAADVTVELVAGPEPDLPVGTQPVFANARAQDTILLDPGRLEGKELSLILRAKETAHRIVSRVLPVRVVQVPFAEPVTIKCIYFGDSHSATLFARYLKAYLAAWNINIVFYGTLENAVGPNYGDGPQQYGEGRGGWGIANIFGTYPYIGGVGSYEVWTSVLGPGSAATAAYTSAVFDTRHRTNPFLSNDPGSGSAVPVIPGSLPLLGGGTATGLRVDLVNYRDRFALPTDIDIVLWDIGDNDVAQVGSAGAVARMNEMYPAILAEFRRAWLPAEIVCWAGGLGMVNRADIMWKNTRPVLAAQVKAVRDAVAAGDDKLRFVSDWMHQTLHSGYPLKTGTVDPVTGCTVTSLSDPGHDDRYPGRAQGLEALSSAIANLIGA
ncbi:hypothetical protein [Novosphingobium soli]|uniref:SGNH/GDSL hydrolase family protein n=1 Tax=Novosphingobium soli TaxID=574956 RepID=A0ABV6CVH7_9SPHN